MQIVINVNEDGEISTIAQSEADYQTRSDAAASGANDGGSAPSSPEDMFADVVTEIPVQEDNAPLDGGSA